jgi:hypothetical protein
MTDADDDELLVRLRRIADEVDGVPDLVTANAQAAFELRRLDDELAELVRDSELADAAVRGTRPRLLTLEADDLTLELQLDETAGRVSLSGLAVGPVQQVEVQTTSTERVVPVDEHGWFRVEDLTAAPLRVRVTTPSGRTVSSGWLRP